MKSKLIAKSTVNTIVVKTSAICYYGIDGKKIIIKASPDRFCCFKSEEDARDAIKDVFKPKFKYRNFKVFTRKCAVTEVLL